MELTLSITPSPALPAETLVAFVKKATSKGKNASAALASLIASDVATPTSQSGRSPMSTRRTAKKKARAA